MDEEMIIKRQKQFGFFSNLFKKNKSNNSTDNENIIQDTKKKNIKIEDIPFAEFDSIDLWPGVVTLGLSTTNLEISELENLFKNIGLINSSGQIEKVYRLNDNVKGKNGLTVMGILFSPSTKIDTGVRLCYGDKIKWQEDFCYYYSGWYKSGKK